MRAFIAIGLPSDTKEIISKIQDELKAVLPKVGWVKPVNLHLTLKFLGEISPKQLNNVKEITAKISKASVDFKLKLETLGVFPNTHTARIIWLGSDQLPEKLGGIVEQIETKIAELGKPKEKRPFLAHITIGRIKSYIDPSFLEEEINKVNGKIGYAKLEFNAKGITLFESILGPQGASYTVLDEANFKDCLKHDIRIQAGN